MFREALSKCLIHVDHVELLLLQHIFNHTPWKRTTSRTVGHTKSDAYRYMTFETNTLSQHTCRVFARPPSGCSGCPRRSPPKQHLFLNRFLDHCADHCAHQNHQIMLYYRCCGPLQHITGWSSPLSKPRAFAHPAACFRTEPSLRWEAPNDLRSQVLFGDASPLSSAGEAGAPIRDHAGGASDLRGDARAGGGRGM